MMLILRKGLVPTFVRSVLLVVVVCFFADPAYWTWIAVARFAWVALSWLFAPVLKQDGGPCGRELADHPSELTFYDPNAVDGMQVRRCCCSQLLSRGKRSLSLCLALSLRPMKVLFNWKGALRSTLHLPLIYARHVFSFFGPSFVLQSKQATMFPSLDAPATIGLTVIVPAYNEEERLPQMLKATVAFLEQRRCVFSHWIMTEYLAI